MTVNPDGALCRCGSRGCWETEVGEVALLARAGRDPDGGRRAIGELVDAARDGDQSADRAFQEQARWLGIGIAGLINIFDPQLVVLGGFFGLILPTIGERLSVEVTTRRFHGVERSVDIVGGRLGPHAGLIGAGERALEPVLSNPLLLTRSS